MAYEKETIAELVPEIKKAGYRVFVAKKGTYGFYTDAEGSRVISFGADLSRVSFSGNYITNQPRLTGTGWVLGYDLKNFDSAFKASPSLNFVGISKWAFTSLKQYLEAYQSSSEFKEV